MAPSSLDENSEMKDTKKRKKRVHNNDDDQASYRENFLALPKKQLENQVSGPRETTDAVFSKIS